MNFTVSSSILLKALLKVSKAIPAKSVIPIIEHFLFDLKGDILTITTTNFDVTMQTTVKVEPAGKDVKVAVASKILISTLRAIADQPIAFNVNDESFSVVATTRSGKYIMASENGKDFPKIPDMDSFRSASITESVLVKAIDKVVFAVHTDPDKGAFNGVYFGLGKTGCVFAGCNASHLSVYKRTDTFIPDDMTFTIPLKAISAINGAFVDADAPLDIEATEASVCFRSNEVAVWVRIIDARYPMFQEVIPKDWGPAVRVGRQELISALGRLNLYADEFDHTTLFEASGSELVITTQNSFSEHKEAIETVPCEVDGDPVRIFLNAEQILNIVKNCPSDEVCFHMSNPSRAVVIVPSIQDAGEDLLMLSMPLRAQ